MCRRQPSKKKEEPAQRKPSNLIYTKKRKKMFLKIYRGTTNLRLLLQPKPKAHLSHFSQITNNKNILC